MTDIDLLIREFRADQPGPETAPAAVAEAAKAARGPRRRLIRRRLLAGAAGTATITGAAVFLVLILPGRGADVPAVPVGQGVSATVRVAVPGGGAVPGLVLDRAVEIIRARASAQGLDGVRVRRDGRSTLSVDVPGSAGREVIDGLIGDPSLRVVATTGTSRDWGRSTPEILAPDQITGLTYRGGVLRLGIRDRTDGELADALAEGRGMALVGGRGFGHELIGTVDTAASATLSSEALLVTPTTPEGGASAAKSLAGGGLEADFDLAALRVLETEDGPRPTSAVLAAMNAWDGGDGPSRVVPETVRPLVAGRLADRVLTLWEGRATAGAPRAYLEVPGGGGPAAGCSAFADDAPVVPCAFLPGAEVGALHGRVAPEVRRVDARWNGRVRARALVQNGRFVVLFPVGVNGVRLVARDGAGGSLGVQDVGLGGRRLGG